MEPMGKTMQIKCKPHVTSKFNEFCGDNSAYSWTPITKHTANTSLGSSTVPNLNGDGYPLVLTVHKSQGATFNQTVYNYDKFQQNQLVYVGLSSHQSGRIVFDKFKK